MQKNISSINIRDDLYPRINHDQARAQRYSEIIDLLPPIEINQRDELIDGKHRLIAHQLAGLENIEVSITETNSDLQLLALAIERNASHGLQMNEQDKRKMARRFYNDELGWSVFSTSQDRAQVKRDLAKILSCSVTLVRDATSDIDKQMRDERKAEILSLYHRCYTTAEIGLAVGLSENHAIKELSEILEDVLKSQKVAFLEENWKPPLYNVWSFAKKTNKTDHFGNTEQRIVENLLYAFTEPGDIVVDPFAGGASTLDVCIERNRRCWISDRKPKPGLEDKVRVLDIAQDLPPLHKRWSEVSLVYLDPPYWHQAKDKYSSDPEDLANYPSSDEFHQTMARVIKAFSKKMRSGSHIALIIQPTQWNAPDRQVVDHVIEIINAVGNRYLMLDQRISCPYQTQQCNEQMVNWAKENKKFLVLSREVILWQVA